MQFGSITTITLLFYYNLTNNISPFRTPFTSAAPIAPGVLNGIFAGQAQGMKVEVPALMLLYGTFDAWPVAAAVT